MDYNIILSYIIIYMYIETHARIISLDDYIVQFFKVWKYGRMEYIETLPDTIELFKNWTSKIRAKISNKTWRPMQWETDVLSIIK